MQLPDPLMGPFSSSDYKPHPVLLFSVSGLDDSNLGVAADGNAMIDESHLEAAPSLPSVPTLQWSDILRDDEEGIDFMNFLETEARLGQSREGRSACMASDASWRSITVEPVRLLPSRVHMRICLDSNLPLVSDWAGGHHQADELVEHLRVVVGRLITVGSITCFIPFRPLTRGREPLEEVGGPSGDVWCTLARYSVGDPAF